MTPVKGRKKAENLKAIRKKVLGDIVVSRAYLRTNGISELDKISRIYLRELVGRVRGDGYAVILIKADKAKVLAERCMPEAARMEYNTDAPAIKELMKTKQLISTLDTRNGSITSLIPGRGSVRSFICAPIILEKDLKVMIYVDSFKENAFFLEDVEVAQLVSQEISVALEQSLHYLDTQSAATGDGFTGWHDYQKFNTDIIDEISNAQKYEEPLSLLIFHINWGESHNEVLENAQDDKPHKQLVDIVAANIRAYHKIYRYGVDEFIICLTDIEKEEAALIALRLKNIIENKKIDGEGDGQPNCKVTLGMGIVDFPSDGQEVNTLVEAAKLALDRSQGSGGRSVGFAH
ncbi:diguanylate cyclase [Chloroflexota bacterium]